MKNIKIIGGLFIFYFLIILGLLLWSWYKFDDDSGPTDFGGLVLLEKLVLIVYYYILIVWTWRLTMRYPEFKKGLASQFVLIFLLGVLTSVIWLIIQIC